MEVKKENSIIVLVIFSSQFPKFIDHERIYQETLRQVIAGEAEHLDDLTYDPVIHTHCALLFADGVPDMYVARRVGHQNSTTTNKIYSHVEKGGSKELGTSF